MKIKENILTVKELREKEEKMGDTVIHPKISKYSTEISRIINDTIASGNKIYVSTDWHLWKRDPDTHTKTHKASHFNNTIKIYEALNNNDLLIYLGDLVDGEFRDSKEDLKETLNRIKCKKIMVRGNNDLFDYSFYKSCGFEYVVNSFVWNDIIFSHYPIENNNEYNICGHIHKWNTFWIPYTNQINAWRDDHSPFELFALINYQKEYKKHIDIKWDKAIVQESMSIFEYENEHYSYFILGEDLHED